MPLLDIQAIDWLAHTVELCGIGLILAGIAVTAVRALMEIVRRTEGSVYHRARERIGHALLLGLELLVAGDIIASIAVELTFESLGRLAILVAVRTFLSWSLEVEIEGRWPWQAPRASRDEPVCRLRPLARVTTLIRLRSLEVGWIVAR